MDRGARTSEVHIFDYEDRKVLYHVESGAFFEISDLVVDLISRGGASKEVCVAELSTRYDLEDILAAMDELAAAEILSYGPRADAHPDIECACKGPSESAAPLPMQMTLHISHACNISCSYCFALGGSYGGRPDLMEPKTAEAAVRWLMDQCGPGGRCQIEFFGGEPLLNFPLMKHVVAYARAEAGRRGITVGFDMTTNGTLLEGEILEFVMAEDIGMMISMDGKAEDHDATRRFHNGAPTHAVIERNVREVTRQRPDLVAIKTTLTSQNLDVQAIAEQLSQYGAATVGIAPSMEHLASPTAIGHEHLPEYKNCLRRLSKAELTRMIDGTDYPHSYFGDKVKDLLEGSGRKHYGCRGGKTFFGVSIDGSIYFCSSFASMPEYRMGDVFSGLDPAKKAFYDGELLVDRREPCRSCWARYLCGGGCIYDAQLVNGSYREPNPVFCEHLRFSYEQAMGMCLELMEARPESRELLTSP
jgi:uncharacterized protein